MECLCVCVCVCACVCVCPGWLFFMTEDGELIQQQRLSKTPQNIFYSSKRNLLAAISRDMLLTVFTVSEAGVEDKISEVCVCECVCV